MKISILVTLGWIGLILLVTGLFSMIHSKTTGFRVQIFHEGQITYADSNTIVFADGEQYTQNRAPIFSNNSKPTNIHYDWIFNLPSTTIQAGKTYRLQRTNPVFFWIVEGQFGISEVVLVP